MSPYAKRTDANHREIVDALRQCGWVCKDTHEYPGWVDVVAHRGGQVRLIEIKSGKGQLKPSQQQLIDLGFPVVVLRTLADVVNLS